MRHFESEPRFVAAQPFEQHISMCCSQKIKNKLCLFLQILFNFNFKSMRLTTGG
jgi:hypothetical protein